MRKLLLTQIFCLLSASALGQTFMTSFKHSFKGLKLENLGAQNIKDLACPQISLSDFSGSGKIDSNSMEVAEELFRICQFSKTQGQPNIAHWDTLMKLRNEYLSHNKIPLMLFDMSFYEFSDSFWTGDGYTINQDSQFFEKLGPWKKHDFNKSNVFYFLPLLNQFNGEPPYVILDNRFILSNKGNDSLVKFSMDINGESVELIPNVPMQLAGLKPGINDCRLSLESSANSERFLLSNHFYNLPNSRRKFVSWVQFNYSNTTPTWKSLLENKEIETFQVRTLGKSETGLTQTLGANVTVHFGKDKSTHRPNSCITNPIVFIEGIDFGYKNNPTGFRDGKCGNMGYLDLLKGQQWNVDSKQWEPWKSIENAPKILNQYRDSGFDIIYIDFWDGADLIENNALVVYQCLKQITNRLCGHELHVVGVSMGGLIGKRALTMLENDTQAYCVKSFTCFDAPLLGANIALSLQATASYYSDLFGISKDMRDRMLNRPASKQMLLMHHEQLDAPHPLRNKFMNDASMQAFPIIPWNWGVVNGSNEGMPQRKIDGTYLTQGEMILHVNAFEELKNKLTKLGVATGKFGIYLAGKLLPTTDAKLFSYQVPLKGAPNGKGAVAVFESNIAKDKTWFVDNKKQGIDHQCGSQNNSISAFANVSKGTLGTIKSELISENTCFIPTWSAVGNPLGSKSWSAPLAYQIGEIPLLLQNTPFQDYYSQSDNQDHAFFDSSKNGNAIWLLRKILSTRNLLTINTNRVYFIGNIEDRFIGNVTVTKGGVLEINNWKKGTNAAASARDSVVISKQKERVFYLGDCKEKILQTQGGSIVNIGSGINGNQPTTLHVKNNSSIQIDSGSILHLTGKQPTLIIHKNSNLTLLDNSTLIIDDGGKLIIEEGGRIVVGMNVKIFLNGANSELKIGGNLHIRRNADFLIRSEEGFSTGLLKLNNVGGGYGKCNITGDGHSDFSIIGNDKTASTVLEIEGVVNTKFVFDTIKIDRADVRFGNQSSLIVNGYLAISNSKFSPLSWAKSKSSNINLETGRLKIYGSTFEKLDVGLKLNEETNHCNISRTDFIQCYTGIQSSGKNLKLSNCMFKANEVGVEIQGSLSPDSLENCHFFSSNNMGLYSETTDTLNVPISVNNCGFYRNQIGAQGRNRSLVFTCTILGYNNIGVVINNAKLICGANSDEHINSDTISSGFNTFAFQDGPSIKAYNADIFVNGKNNFIRSIDKKSTIYELSGSLASGGSGGSSTQKNLKLDLGENYWQPTKWNYTIDSIQEKYTQIGYYDIGGHFNEIAMKGKLSNSQFVQCYDPNGSISSAMKLGGLDNEYSDILMAQGISNHSSIYGSNDWLKNVEVYTTEGKLIRRFETYSPTTHETFDFSPGIYILRWQNGENAMQSKKMIVSEK